MGQAYSVRLSSVKNDPAWKKCEDECYLALPEQINGEIYQLWEGGKIFQGVLTRSPTNPKAWGGWCYCEGEEPALLSIAFCLKVETNSLMMMCTGPEWCWATSYETINWYCLPYHLGISDNGLIKYRIYI